MASPIFASPEYRADMRRLGSLSLADLIELFASPSAAAQPTTFSVVANPHAWPSA
jgi:hypothetical protein